MLFALLSHLITLRAWQGTCIIPFHSVYSIRCVDDYRFYNTFPFSLFMPSQLKFRGHHIKVTHAPEPDEIVWENLEV